MLRFILVVVCLVVGLEAAARLQIHENARFVSQSGTVYEGTVSRQLLSGDCVISTADAEYYIPYEQFGVMAYKSDSISIGSGLALWSAWLLAAFIGLWPFLPPLATLRQWGAERKVRGRQRQLESGVLHHLDEQRRANNLVSTQRNGSGTENQEDHHDILR